MDEGICRQGAVFGSAPACRDGSDGELSARYLEEVRDTPGGHGQNVAPRGGFDAHGQVLPPWLTYTTVTKTIDGQVTTSEGVETLPETYYGASIPLGPGWVYGGTTSRLASVPTVSSTPTLTITTTTPGSSSMRSSSLATSSSGSNRQVTSSAASPSTLTPASRSSSRATESLSSDIPHSSSLILPSTRLESLPPGIATTHPFSTTDSTPSSSSSTSRNDHNHLVPLLPELLVPILFLLLLLCLLRAYIYKRHKTYQPSTISPSPPPWVPRRLVPILYPRIGYAPPPLIPSTPARPSGLSLPLGSARSPLDEKSALLSGFTPQHHRHSSSLSALANSTGQHGAEEAADKVADLPAQHPSLLQRLTLGLGLFGNPTVEPRRPSGFTLEKGLSGPRYTAVSPSHRSSGSSSGARPQTATVASTKPSREGVGGSGQDSSSGHFRSIPDDQLFFKSPTRTVSSRNTSSGSGSSSRGLGAFRGWKSRFEYACLPADTVPLQESGDPDQVSLAVPETPGSGSLADDLDLGEFGRRTRWSRHDRMSFPKPPAAFEEAKPGATPATGLSSPGRQHADEKQRQILMTADSGGSLQTAQSGSHSAIAIPPPHNTHHSPGAPISRDDPGYRHASLSAFGSHPSTPAHSLSQDNSSSQGDPAEDAKSGLNPVSTSFFPGSTSLTAAPPWGLSASRGAMSPPRINVQRANELIRPLQDFFRLSPPSTAGLSDSGRSGVRHSQRSFPGKPLVDMRISEGVTLDRKGKGVGEFGEPLRPSRQGSLGIIDPLASAEINSETASIYSQPSGIPTRSMDESSGRSSPPALSDKALRGRRSRQQLLRATGRRRRDIEKPSSS
ncbi:hypothetical protein DB88DRAFT_543025 [Papiliotrema laurentii]|uniref:Uncharacterized protein n=1 Tax=Papiliotrema laurentii TaxID=5418 RepID=A0AAD9FMF1_PAPLA|nr:hypothetical protein DB88DRAFT_543025 [Papiliotrema laurentii]